LLAEEPSRPGGGLTLAHALGAEPALNMGLRLGECSAAVLALPLLSAAAALPTAEAAGNVLEVESPPRRRSFASDADATFLPVPRSPRTPVEVAALPPVPTFMGRGTARRPVEAPAPAPSFGARANYDPVLDE